MPPLAQLKEMTWSTISENLDLTALTQAANISIWSMAKLS